MLKMNNQKQIAILLVLLSTLTCMSMETCPIDMVKYILTLSLYRDTYRQARQTYVSTKLVCKQWHSLLKQIPKKDIASLIVSLGQNEDTNPGCIAALIGTHDAADWLQAYLNSISGKEIFSFLQNYCEIVDENTNGYWRQKEWGPATNRVNLERLPTPTKIVMQNFLESQGTSFEEVPFGESFRPLKKYKYEKLEHQQPNRGWGWTIFRKLLPELGVITLNNKS